MNVDKKDIWLHYLAALKETEVTNYGVMNRNLTIALYNDLDEYTIEKFVVESKLWFKKMLLEFDQQSLALFGGLCDLAFSFWMVNKKRAVYEKELKILDEIIFNSLEKKISYLCSNQKYIIEKDFDTISGLAGIVSYCFLRKNYFDELNEQIIKLFVSKTNGTTGWKIEKNFLDSAYKKIFPNGYINLSISHGILGPLVTMCEAFRRGYEIDGLKESIEKILHFYANTLDGNRDEIPCIIDASEEKKRLFYDRDSWSYGTTVMLYSISKAAELIKDNERHSLYRNILFDKIRTRVDVREYKCISSTLINGYAGILCLLKKLQKEEGNAMIDERVSVLEKQLLEKYDPTTKFGFKHYEYKWHQHNRWSVESYDSPGIACGALGVIMAIQGDEDIVKTHLLLY